MWTTVGNVLRRMWRTPAFYIVIAGALAAVVWTLFGDRGNDEARRDADVVYCLADEARPRLAAAAKHLGLAGPAGGLFDDWRRDHTADFERACAALVAAEADGGSGGAGASPTILAALLLAVIPAAASAWLTWLVTERRDAGGIRRQEAAALRSASLRFTQAAEIYLRRRQSAPGAPANIDALHERRAELNAQLSQIEAAHPKWSVPGELSATLHDEFGDDLVRRPGPVSSDLIADRLTGLRAFGERVERVAMAHIQPRRRRAPAPGPIMAGRGGAA